MLVGVHADPPHLLLLRGVERAEAATARDLEDHDGAGGDLVQRDLLALRRVREVLRVVVQRLDPWHRRLRTRLVARDEAVDRRLLLPADGRDDGRTARLRRQARGIACEVADLLLLEEQALDVLQVPFVGVRHVDDREVRLRELLRHGRHRLDLGEPDADHELVSLPRERAQVRDVVGRRLRLDDARTDGKVLRGPLKPDERKMVEAAVVQAAEVGDEADLVRRGRRARRRGHDRQPEGE